MTLISVSYRLKLVALVAVVLTIMTQLVSPTFAFQMQSSFRSTRSNISSLSHNNYHLKNSYHTSTQLCSRWYNNDIEGPDRFKACIPYMLPLLDGDYFGHYIFERIPPLHTLDQLFLAPLVETLQSFPFLSILLFLILSLGTRNPAMPRSLRFNAQQAVLIDIGLIFPTLFVEAFKGFEDVVPRSLAEMGCNFVWYAYMSAIIYSCYCNLKGKKPDQIPIISETAELLVGPI